MINAPFAERGPMEEANAPAAPPVTNEIVVDTTKALAQVIK